jgi:hypothetical protein
VGAVMPNITRGGSTDRVLAYLIGKGRSGEHVNPHLVVGRAWAMFEKGGGRTLSNRGGDARELAAFIDGPMNEALVDGRLRKPPTRSVTDQDGKVVERSVHVWHCSLALHPEEPELGDERWGEIASRYMALMGLEPADDEPACRWVAVHHGKAKGGNDHIHIVANVIAEDGRRWNEHNDRVRAQNAAAELEREFGLRITEGRARGAGQRGYKQGELEADKRRGREGVGAWEVQDDGQRRIGSESRSPAASSRQTLERIVRACATAAVDEPDFLARLREEGVVALARYAKGSETEIVGYAVALRTANGEALEPIGGGRLARDLTLPRLRQMWPEVAADVIADAWRNPSKRTRQPPGPALQERCVEELDALREQLRDVDPRDRVTWAHVARDAAGILSAWSLRTEPQPGALAAAARSLAGTAAIRQPRGDRRRWHGAPARHTAQLVLGSGRARTSVGLVRKVVFLSEQLGEMHAAANEAQRAFELEIAAARQLDAVRGLQGRPAPPQVRPNLDGPRGTDSDLER